METTKIAAYSLLAHINNNQKGIKDFTDIFLPLVKRVLAKMNTNGSTKGLQPDIKAQVDATYGFDIPYPFLQKMLKRIAHEVNTTENDFRIFGDGSFIMKKFVFADYEDTLLEQEAQIESVKLAYEKFLEVNNLDPAKEPSIFDYLDKNRVALSQFFASRSTNGLDAYLNQAKFLLSIKGAPETFKILKKIYLGSIITSYLEVDLRTPGSQYIDFVLDTNFLVSVSGPAFPGKPSHQYADPRHLRAPRL